MTSITIHRIADGKVAKKWTEKDVMGFLQQIAVIPRMDISGLRKKTCSMKSAQRLPENLKPGPGGFASQDAAKRAGREGVRIRRASRRHSRCHL
jgi:hypothetical protein